MSSEETVSFEEMFSEEARQKALEIFDYGPEITADEPDFKELFARILWEEDWTDRVASLFAKLRGMFHSRGKDTVLSEDLRSLIPDMNLVAKAYEEMTSGYKDFIKTVWQARNHRQRWTEEE